MVNTRFADDNRGQLLVIGAIGFAFIIIGLALVVNSMALVNLSGGLEANHPSVNQYEAETSTNLDKLLRQTNRLDSGSSYSTIESNLQERYSDYQELHERQTLSNGQLVTQELVSVEHGTKIEQTSAANYTGVNGTKDWTLVSDTQRFRRFELKLDGDYLGNGDNLNDKDVSYSELQSREIFTVRITEANGDEWEIYFYSRGTDKDVRLRVATPSDTLLNECFVNDDTSSGYATVNLAEATLNGKHSCEQLRFLDQLERPVDIRYEDSQKAYGTYELFVSKDKSNIDSDNFGSDPSLNRIAYAATVRVTYLSESEEATITIESAPEEADGDYYGR